MTNILGVNSRSGFRRRRLSGYALGLILVSSCVVAAQEPRRGSSQVAGVSVPRAVLLRIIRAEDERRWDKDLSSLLSDPSPSVRARAALAAGRIGDELAIPALISLMQNDKDDGVRNMAAFALGEIESATAADALAAQIAKSNASELRARLVEALGKIAGALPPTSEEQRKQLGKTILGVLDSETQRSSIPDTEVILLGLTAVLRARPEGAGKAIVEFLRHSDPRVRSDAGNVLARLRAKDGNEELRKLLTSDPDANVRANAARVLGATEDKAAFDGLLDRALKDPDSRVRVSAIRALASLKDARAAVSLMERGAPVILVPPSAKKPRNNATPPSNRPGANELLEIATALGRLRQGSNDEAATRWLKHGRRVTGHAPEVEIALARIHPADYLAQLGTGSLARQKAQETILVDWRAASSIAQGLGEIAALTEATGEYKQLRKQAEDLLRAMLDYRNSGINIKTLVAVHSEYAIPDVLRALAAFKPKDLDEVLRKHLKDSDVVIRATAAELLGELPLNVTNIEALRAALTGALRDKELNDAALAILDALAKQKNRNANEAIKIALDSPDYLVRRKAIDSLKATGAGDFSARLGPVQSRNSAADYARAISRVGKRVLAVVSTSKGSFTIELLPEAAPLNVDNFLQLAKRGYFNGIVFHRVVPNFVVQDGDPRGDGNGGPGYQIRCEINEVPYDRGAVGMALSGKDTGGSQWFVTHAPQPHLDGGYTVFGKVVAGMDVVDKIARGDLIRSITVKESTRRDPSRGR